MMPRYETLTLHGNPNPYNIINDGQAVRFIDVRPEQMADSLSELGRLVFGLVHVEIM